LDDLQRSGADAGEINTRRTQLAPRSQKGKMATKKYTTTWTCAENEEARRKRVENGEARRKREENEEARKKTEEHEAAWRASMKGGIQSADTLGGPIDDL
jgi:glutamyl/glutaminyl-tRNA synthetase